jgi:hypothetical protein
LHSLKLFSSQRISLAPALTVVQAVIMAQIEQNSKITKVLMTILQLLMDTLSKQLA